MQRSDASKLLRCEKFVDLREIHRRAEHDVGTRVVPRLRSAVVKKQGV
jgi:hypothetical protein